MTIDERLSATRDAIKEIENRFGVRIIAALYAEPFSMSVSMIKGIITIEPIPGWKENHVSNVVGE